MTAEQPSLNDLFVGKTIAAIRMSADLLACRFTDGTHQTFTAESDDGYNGDAYFWDFIGVEKLLNNGPILSTRWIDLTHRDPAPAPTEYPVETYGFELVTEHPTFGEVTSVVSFRNISNGYYGGHMVATNDAWPEDLPDLTTDVLGT